MTRRIGVLPTILAGAPLLVDQGEDATVASLRSAAAGGAAPPRAALALLLGWGASRRLRRLREARELARGSR